MSVVEQSPPNVIASPGSILRDAREKAGIRLETVAQRTMIPLVRLQALENDDYTRVGVPTFVSGYTRSYARFLGIDPAPLLRDLQKVLPQIDPLVVEAPPVALALQVQKRPKSLFWPVVFVVVILLVLVAYLGVTSTSLLPSNGVTSIVPVANDSTTDVAAGRARPLPVPVKTEVMNERVGTEEETSPAIPEGEVLRDDDFSPAITPDPALSEAVPQDSLSAPPATDELTVSFTGDCWISVTDATGKAIIARNVTSGDNLRLFGQAPFEVVLGDAAVATLALNGQAVDTTPLAGRKSRRLTVGE